MGKSDEFGWLDVELIGEQLAESHPTVDPFSVRFTALAGMVEKLPGFMPDPDHPCNEKILEAIQAAWHAAREDLPGADDDD
ncbi:MAG: Fe-S cluster assembly protein IscX [bacterium]|jgi:FeS assembly protein IscX|nr:Fe-S cluster assembly protein IscX [Phycisphaerales bacterium]MCE2653640.1 Fe-S cluster assembly protein IscX [Planctomycetaceae bacterium]